MFGTVHVTSTPLHTLHAPALRLSGHAFLVHVLLTLRACASGPTVMPFCYAHGPVRGHEGSGALSAERN